MELIDLRPLLILCSFNVSTIVLQGNVDEEESFILRDRLLPLIICLLRTVSSIIVLHSNYLFVVSWAWVRLQMSPCLTCLFIWGISLLPFFLKKITLVSRIPVPWYMDDRAFSGLIFLWKRYIKIYFWKNIQFMVRKLFELCTSYTIKGVAIRF
jgi:hypothetical protein